MRALKIGNTVGAALARVNIAEILIDRGEWAEAEALLLETLPFWKASQYHYLPRRVPFARSDGCRCAWAASTRR